MNFIHYIYFIFSFLWRIFSIIYNISNFINPIIRCCIEFCYIDG